MPGKTLNATSPESSTGADQAEPDPLGASVRDSGLGLRVDDGGANPFDIRRNGVFAAAIRATRMPMVISDPNQEDNPIIFANQAFLAMTGYTSEEVIGSNCRFLQGPETDRQTLADIRLAVEQRREIATEVLNYRKDGYSFWNALFISPVFDDAGDLVCFVASQLDVSRRREAEDALRHAQKMEAIGRLTGGIAHDFNNLLQVMVGYLELIGSGLRKPEINREKLLRGIGNARAAADRATNLTQQLLAFARKRRLEGKVLNLNDLVDTMRQLVGRTLGDDVTIEIKAADDLWNCRVDPAQVEIALLNILINARDAMRGRAGKRVIIETANLIINHEDLSRYPSLAPGRYASIALGDTGAGLPIRIVERMMDPFFVTKDEGQGTGLGLTMVYGFAKQSGGAAYIQSEENVGTTVRIYFPAVDEAAPPRAGPSTRALDRLGTETILVVEARAEIAEIARMILEDFGYTVCHARTGRDALALIDGGVPIDMLFSDLVMPDGSDGVELARSAKQRRNTIKVLLTTGYAEASLERSDMGGAEFDVLYKPYGRTDLARKVRVILDGPTGVG